MQQWYPDKIMCCLCFNGFDKSELWRDEDGTTWDVCVPCHEAEVRAMIDKGLSWTS